MRHFYVGNLVCGLPMGSQFKNRTKSPTHLCYVLLRLRNIKYSVTVSAAVSPPLEEGEEKAIVNVFDVAGGGRWLTLD